MSQLLEQMLLQARPDGSQGAFAGILLALIVSTVTAVLVRLLYRLFYEESDTGSQIDRSFLLLSPAITTLFITIQFSLPLSLGLLGALSIVRFRVPIREPEEIGFLMVVIASAIACATYSYVVLATLLVIVVVALLLQRYLGGRIPGLRRSGGLLMLTVADAVYARHAAAIESVLSARLGWIRLEHLNGREGVTTLNYTFRARERTDWSAIRHELEALGPVDALSVLRAPQGGV
jgi:signal transduction histidine kinase